MMAPESSKYLNKSVVSVHDVGIEVVVGCGTGRWFWSLLLVGRGVGRLPPPLDIPISSVPGAAVGEFVMLEKSLAWLELAPNMPVKSSAATAPPANRMRATARISRCVFFHSQPQQLTYSNLRREREV